LYWSWSIVSLQNVWGVQFCRIELSMGCICICHDISLLPIVFFCLVLCESVVRPLYCIMIVQLFGIYMAVCDINTHAGGSYCKPWCSFFWTYNERALPYSWVWWFVGGMASLNSLCLLVWNYLVFLIVCHFVPYYLRCPLSGVWTKWCCWFCSEAVKGNIVT